MNVILLTLSPQHNRLTIRKAGIRITCLEMNSKTYISLKSICLIFINLIIFFNHICPISQRTNYTLREKIFVISNDNKAMKIEQALLTLLRVF